MLRTRVFLCLVLSLILLTACSRESREAVVTRIFTSGGTAAAEGFIVGRTVAAEAVRTGAPVARTLAAEGAVVGGTIGAIALSTGGPIAGTAAAGGFNALNTRLAEEPGYSCPATLYTVDHNLNEIVDISGTQLDAAIAATVPGSPLIGLGQAFASAGRDKGINAYYIAAHAAWDSAWGTTPAATRKNNLFAYGASPICPFDCAVTYSSQTESIDAVMTLVKNDYLTSGGRFYNGGTLRGMGPIYAPGNTNWPEGIAAIMNLLRQNTPCP
ncbi:MAG: glucosaminidase domain-containing protein [Chloroflexota bacterium]|jgi:hypothetical protein